MGTLPVGVPINEHVGKRVQTFWDGDGWYEALVSDYNAATVRQACAPAAPTRTGPSARMPLSLLL